MAGRFRVAVLVLLGLVAGCGDGRSAVPPAGTPSTAPPVTVTVSPPPKGVAVWFVGDTPAGPRLFRELRAVRDGGPDGSPPDAVGIAVSAMLAGTATDPDLRTDWPAGVRLRGPVQSRAGELVVDLAISGPQPGPAGLALQQLVHTVQGAAGSADPVRVLVGGEPAVVLLGEPVSAPLTRADPLAVRTLVEIDDPVHGAVVGSPVAISGEAAVFEATVLWEVRDAAGKVVREGFATTAEGQRFAPYRFEVALPPGSYEVVVSEDDPSGGAGRPPMSDSVRITVR